MDAIDPTYTDLVIEGAKAIIAIALAVLVPLASALTARLLRKAGLEINAEHEAMIRARIRDVALRIEEEAAQRIKRGDAAPTAAMKLERLVNELLDYIVQRVPKAFQPIAERQLRRWVNEELPKIGIGAIASLKAKWLEERNPPPIAGQLVELKTSGGER